MVAHACNPSTQESEAGGSSLCSMLRPCWRVMVTLVYDEDLSPEPVAGKTDLDAAWNCPVFNVCCVLCPLVGRRKNRGTVRAAWVRVTEIF